MCEVVIGINGLGKCLLESEMLLMWAYTNSSTKGKMIDSNISIESISLHFCKIYKKFVPVMKLLEFSYEKNELMQKLY